MKRAAAFFGIVGALCATVLVAEESCKQTSLGSGVKLAEATPIASIAEKPDEFVGKAVRIEGEVAAVCEMRGCWMELVAEGGAALRIKVDDGDIVFPVAAKGRRAAAEGVVESIEMDRKQFVKFRKHEAKETGVAFDEASLGEGPFKIVRLKGTGAEVCL
jgi:hypothetical protein